MKLLTWLKSLWTRRKTVTLTPNKTTTTSVYWGAQYRYKPDNKEHSHADS